MLCITRNSYITGSIRNFVINITLLLEVVWNFIYIFIYSILFFIFLESLKTFVSLQTRRVR